MPGQVLGPNFRSPFGRNHFLRSTRDFKTESYTCAQAGVPTQTVDGRTVRVLQPGCVMAKIASGPNAGKVGVYDSGASPVAPGLDDESAIVGINNTFLPWQFNDGDREIAVVVEARVVKDWLIEAHDGVLRQFQTSAAVTAMKGADDLRIMFAAAPDNVT